VGTVLLSSSKCSKGFLNQWRYNETTVLSIKPIIVVHVIDREVIRD
jgi:hypothetical protein